MCVFSRRTTCLPIDGAGEPASSVDQTGIEQLDQRGEVRVVAVVRRRGQQQQPVAAPSDHLREAPAQRVVTVRAGGGTDAVVRLVDDRQVPRRTLEVFEHALLLGEIQRGEAERGRIERIAAQFEPASLQLQRSRIGDQREPQTEALPHLLVPLRQQRAGRRDDQHAVRTPPRDQFADDEPGLDRLAEADAIGKQKTRPRQFERTHERNELVRLDLHPARLGKQQVRGPEHLLEQAGLQMQPPCGQRPGCIGPEIGTQQFDPFGRVQQVPFEPAQIAGGAAQVQQLLGSELLDLDNVPREAAHADPAPGSEFHVPTVGGDGLTSGNQACPW